MTRKLLLLAVIVVIAVTAMGCNARWSFGILPLPGCIAQGCVA